MDKIERLKRFFISAAGQLKRFWNWLDGVITGIMNWLKEPRRTPGEQWAIDNGVHDAWQEGYADGLRHGRKLVKVHIGYSHDHKRAYELGRDDAEFDLDRQW